MQRYGSSMFPADYDAKIGLSDRVDSPLTPDSAVSLTDQQQRQAVLVDALHDPACYAHPTRDIRVIETHISLVVLTGAFVYKIKKPLNLGFLDFSTPQRRKYFCEEEVRLNGRYAPELYLGVVTFSGSPGAPFMRDQGEGFEYAVRMVQFDENALLSAMLAREELQISQVRKVAEKVADFHLRDAARCDAATLYGTQARVLSPMLENFSQLQATVPDHKITQRLAALEKWTRRAGIELADQIEQRRQQGFVRECHGDLHLDNIAWLSGHPVMFDGIEFNPYLRFIDTISEIAFTVMDLRRHGARTHANVLLNDYMEVTADYEGLRLFNFYSVYRALVRAKIVAIRSRQEGKPTAQLAEFQNCLEVAIEYTQPSTPTLMITHGLSGSGKSFVADKLVQNHGLLRLRSDYLRKRLHGFAPNARTDAAHNEGIYSPQATEKTYTRLAAVTEKCLRAGFSLVADATFLRFKHREMFRQLADRVGADFTILDIHAADQDIDARLQLRRGEVDSLSEADHAILSAQRRTVETLTTEELSYTKRVLNSQGNEPKLDDLFV